MTAGSEHEQVGQPVRGRIQFCIGSVSLRPPSSRREPAGSLTPRCPATTAPATTASRMPPPPFPWLCHGELKEEPYEEDDEEKPEPVSSSSSSSSLSCLLLYLELAYSIMMSSPVLILNSVHEPEFPIHNLDDAGIDQFSEHERRCLVDDSLVVLADALHSACAPSQ